MNHHPAHKDQAFHAAFLHLALLASRSLSLERKSALDAFGITVVLLGTTTLAGQRLSKQSQALSNLTMLPRAGTFV